MFSFKGLFKRSFYVHFGHLIAGSNTALVALRTQAGSRPAESTLFGLVGLDYATLALPLGLLALLALARPLGGAALRLRARRKALDRQR